MIHKPRSEIYCKANFFVSKKIIQLKTLNEQRSKFYILCLNFIHTEFVQCGENAVKHRQEEGIKSKLKFFFPENAVTFSNLNHSTVLADTTRFH